MHPDIAYINHIPYMHTCCMPFYCMQTTSCWAYLRVGSYAAQATATQELLAVAVMLAAAGGRLGIDTKMESLWRYSLTDCICSRNSYAAI